MFICSFVLVLIVVVADEEEYEFDTTFKLRSVVEVAGL
jgi:hypothetical protein